MNSKDYRINSLETKQINELTEQIADLIEEFRNKECEKDLTMLDVHDISVIMKCSEQRARDIMKDPELHTIHVTNKMLVNKDEFYDWTRRRKRTMNDSIYWRNVSRAA